MAEASPFPVFKLCNPCGGAAPPYELQLIHYGGYLGYTGEGFWVSGISIVDAGTVIRDNALFPFLFPGEVAPYRDTEVKIRVMRHIEFPNRGTVSCSDLSDPIEFDIEDWDTRETYLPDLVANNHKLSCASCPTETPYCSNEPSDESDSIERIINAVGEFDWSLIPTWGTNPATDGNLTCIAYLYYNPETELFEPTYSFVWGVGPPINTPNGYFSTQSPTLGQIPFGLMQFITSTIGEDNTLVPPYERVGNPPFVGFRFWIARPRIRLLASAFCRLVTVDADGEFHTVLEDLLTPRMYALGEIVEPTWNSERFISAGLPSVLLLVEGGTDECL